MIRRIALIATAFVMALTGITLSATSASAATVGNDFCVNVHSPSNDYVRSLNELQSIFNIYKGHCSYEYLSQRNRVQAFYVQPGDSCVSQWGHSYLGGAFGNWVFFKTSNNFLDLTCYDITR